MQLRRALDATLVLAALALSPVASAAMESAAQEFDSAVNVALDGTITGGKVITDTDDPRYAESQAKAHLQYAIGHLNGMGGGIEATKIAVTMRTATPRPDGLYDYTYDATARLSWPRSVRVPASYELLLPARGDYTGLYEFIDAYGSDETTDKKCLADDASAIGSGNFWYYYRPQKRGCGVTVDRSGMVAPTRIALTLSDTNSSGKFPEYGKVWEDGRLVVTAVFSKYQAGATTRDAGINAYAAFYADLRRTFGVPTTTSLTRGQTPGADTPEVRATYRSARGPIDVAMFLVDTVTGAGMDFRRAYAERTEISDFVAYNGHSGLGANITALARLGSFVSGQYQIFMLNGCDTFSYEYGPLLSAHQAANPTDSPSRYLDVITNARPSPFAQMARATVAVTSALAGARKTYRQLLGEMDTAQRAAVDGEQDNVWPAPFDE